MIQTSVQMHGKEGHSCSVFKPREGYLGCEGESEGNQESFRFQQVSENACALDQPSQSREEEIMEDNHSLQIQMQREPVLCPWLRLKWAERPQGRQFPACCGSRSSIHLFCLKEVQGILQEPLRALS